MGDDFAGMEYTVEQTVKLVTASTATAVSVSKSGTDAEAYRCTHDTQQFRRLGLVILGMRLEKNLVDSLSGRNIRPAKINSK